jgi:hypothetical protein
VSRRCWDSLASLAVCGRPRHGRSCIGRSPPTTRPSPTARSETNSLTAAAQAPGGTCWRLACGRSSASPEAARSMLRGPCARRAHAQRKNLGQDATIPGAVAIYFRQQGGETRAVTESDACQPGAAVSCRRPCRASAFPLARQPNRGRAGLPGGHAGRSLHHGGWFAAILLPAGAAGGVCGGVCAGGPART